MRRWRRGWGGSLATTRRILALNHHRWFDVFGRPHRTRGAIDEYRRIDRRRLRDRASTWRRSQGARRGRVSRTPGRRGRRHAGLEPGAERTGARMARVVDQDLADQSPGGVERSFLECGHRSCVGGLYAWVRHGINRCWLARSSRWASSSRWRRTGRNRPGSGRLSSGPSGAGSGRHDNAAGPYFPLRHRPIRVEARNRRFSWLWRRLRVDKPRGGG